MKTLESELLHPALDQGKGSRAPRESLVHISECRAWRTLNLVSMGHRKRKKPHQGRKNQGASFVLSCSEFLASWMESSLVENRRHLTHLRARKSIRSDASSVPQGSLSSVKLTFLLQLCALKQLLSESSNINVLTTMQHNTGPSFLSV